MGHDYPWPKINLSFMGLIHRQMSQTSKGLFLIMFN